MRAARARIVEFLAYAPPGFDKRQARAYLLSKLGYPAGCVYHSIALAMFYALDATQLVYFNVVSIATYALCTLIAVRARNIHIPFVLGPVLEMPLHALVASLAFGLGSGWFLWALTPAILAFLMPVPFGLRVLTSGFNCALFSLIALLGVLNESWYDMALSWQVVFVAFNSFAFATMLAGLFGLNAKVANDAEEALEAEYIRSESLLYNLLPEAIAARLKAAPDRIIADSIPKVAILFADIVGFTPRAATLPPEEVVRFLNRVFSRFDELAEEHGLEKIKTVGDAYMVAAGMPNPCPDPVHRIAEMALDMQAEARALSSEFPDGLDVRIGLHAGPAVAGVIGHKKLFYDVWGETVNTASRMESDGQPGRIQVTGPVQAELVGDYRFEERGVVDVKGMGAVKTWWLLGPNRAA